MPNTGIAVLVSLVVLAIGVVLANLFGHNSYGDVLQTVETCVEVAILYFVILEGSKVVGQVKEIRDATSTVIGSTDALQVGSRVHVLMPQAGKPRNEWPYSSEVWVIRSVDTEKNRAIATPVLPPLHTQGQTPTVDGPMTGPLSPFIETSISG